MVEPIKSAEKFGHVTTSLGEAPKHTVEGHETCAYYADHRGDDPDEILCPHGVAAFGAFYSEDLLNEIRRQFHPLLSELSDPTVRAQLRLANRSVKITEMVKGLVELTK